MMQLTAQQTDVQARNEAVDTMSNSEFLNQTGSSQLSPKISKDTSKFENALQKFLGLNGMNFSSKLNNASSDELVKDGETVQNPVDFLFSNRPGMSQLPKHMGLVGITESHTMPEGALPGTQKPGEAHAVTTKTVSEAQASGNAIPLGATDIVDNRPLIGIKTGQPTPSFLNDEVQPNTSQKGSANQIAQQTQGKGIDEATRKGRYVAKQNEPSSALGDKHSAKSVSVNMLGVSDKNTLLKLTPEQHARSVEELAVFKKLALKQDADTANELGNQAPKMASDSKAQASQQSVKKSPLAPKTAVNKNIQQMADGSTKSSKSEQKTEKNLPHNGAKDDAGSGTGASTGTKRAASAVLQTSSTTAAFKNHPDAQHGGILNMNASNTFDITDTGNKQLDFKFEGGTGAEQLNTDNKWTQDTKLNTTFHQINTMAGRRDMSVLVARNIQRGWASQGQNMEQWQNHRFVFDDGKTFNISVRNTEGILQLQLGTGNSELSKLIQQNLNELHGYLQQQLNINIDLNMQNFGSEQFENEKDSSNGQVSSTGMMESAPESGVMESSRNPTRYFGFNQKEWTA